MAQLSAGLGRRAAGRGRFVFNPGARASVAAAVALLLAGAGAGVQAAALTWKGGSGSWMDATQWTPALVPGGLDDVTIKAGAATLNVDLGIHGLTLTGGAQVGQATLTAQQFNWSAGLLSGAGGTTVTAAASLAANTLTIDAGHTLTLKGDTSWAKGHSVTLANKGTLINESGATFTDLGSNFGTQSYSRQLGSGGGSFINRGTYVHDGIGITNLHVFDNQGVIDVRQGAVNFAKGNAVAGAVKLASGTALTFSAGDSTLTSAVTGSGWVELQGGSLVVDAAASVQGSLALSGGTLTVKGNLADIQALTLNAGLRTGVGDITAKTLSSAGGTLGGTGHTTIDGAASLAANTLTIDAGHTLTLKGDTSWAKGHSVTLANKGTLINESGATFTDLGSNFGTQSYSRQLGSGGGSFINRGTYVHDGIGITNVGRLINSGEVRVNTGSVNVDNDFRNDGVVTVAANAWLHANGNQLTNDGVMRGFGTIQTYSAAYALLNRGTIDPGAQGQLGTLTVDGDLTMAADSIFHVDLGLGQASDLLDITDHLNLGGKLQIGWAAGTSLNVGDVFTIAKFKGGRTGTFGSVDWGAFPSMGFDVVYNADNIQLRVSTVPEAEGWALFLAGMGVTLVAARRRPRASC